MQNDKTVLRNGFVLLHNDFVALHGRFELPHYLFVGLHCGFAVSPNGFVLLQVDFVLLHYDFAPLRNDFHPLRWGYAVLRLCGLGVIKRGRGTAVKSIITLDQIEELDFIHQRLDTAVLAAYGWPPNLSDEQLLERLLALNLARAGK